MRSVSDSKQLREEYCKNYKKSKLLHQEKKWREGVPRGGRLYDRPDQTCVVLGRASCCSGCDFFYLLQDSFAEAFL